MQKLKIKNIAMLTTIVLVVGLLVFGKLYGFGFLSSQEDINQVVNSTTELSSASESPKRGLVTKTDIELPPEPVNGVTKGVVEVGASTFSSFVAVIDKQGRYKVTSKQFGESLAYEGMTSTEEAKSGLKKYIAQMFNKGVSKENVHFVISSGALKEPKMKVIADGIRAAGFFVNEVDPKQEGRWALQAAMNPLYKDKSFVVDIGSGNTKISWYLEGGTVINTTEASGSKYFQNGISDADVFREIKDKVSYIPANKRQICFVIGGVPNTLAKQHGSNSERYIQLKDLSSYSPGDDKKVASGLNILKAIQKGTNVSQFIFDNDSNFTIGFLMSLK